MKPQTEYKDKRIRGYGCAVCSVIAEVLRAVGLKDFSDRQMEKLLHKAYEAGTLTGNCYVMDWGYLGDIVLEVLGYKGSCSLVLLKRSGSDTIQVLSGKHVNGFVMQYDQVNKSGWYHFTGQQYNPDLSLKISAFPTGIRGLNIDIRGKK